MLWFLYRVCWQVFTAKLTCSVTAPMSGLQISLIVLTNLAGVKSSTAGHSGKLLSHLRGLDDFLMMGMSDTQFVQNSVSRVQGVAFFRSLKPLIDRNGSNWRSSYRISVLWDFNEVVSRMTNCCKHLGKGIFCLPEQFMEEGKFL